MSSFSFVVDAVEPVCSPCETRSLDEVLGEFLEGSPLVTSAELETQVVAGPQVHPLAAAVHLAFSEHRPLVLSPDIVWLTIAQGFALHVSHHATELRERFVRFEGRETLTVDIGRIPDPRDWPALVEQWSAQIVEHMGDGLGRLFECSFSTSDAACLVASRITMMAAFRKYFDYELVGICGIPRVTLLGTVEDWRAIRQRIDVLAEYGLSWWTSRLMPICDQLVATAAGEPDVEFWQSIYKPAASYGGDVMTGWLADLYPYLKRSGLDRASGLCDRRNPTLDHDIPLAVDIGLRLDNLPGGLSEVPVRAKALPWSSVALVGGMLGVTVDDDGCVTALPGWCVRAPSTREQVFDRFIEAARDGVAYAPRTGVEDGIRFQYQSPCWPADLQALSERMAAPRFDGGCGWQIHCASPLESVEAPEPEMPARVIEDKSLRVPWLRAHRWNGLSPALRLCDFDLDDAGQPRRALLMFLPRGGTESNWIVEAEWEETSEGRVPRCPWTDDTPVLACSLTELLEKILEHEGEPWFDAPDFEPDLRLGARHD